MLFQLFTHVCRNISATFHYYDHQLCSCAFQWMYNCSELRLNPSPVFNFIFSREKSNKNERTGHSYQSCHKSNNFTTLSLGFSCFMLISSTCPQITIIVLQIISMLALLSLNNNPGASSSKFLTSTIQSMLPHFQDTCLDPIIDSIVNSIHLKSFSTMSSTRIEPITSLITTLVES